MANPYTSDRAVKLFGKIGWPLDDCVSVSHLDATIRVPLLRSYLIDKLVAAGCHISIYPLDVAVSDSNADRVAHSADLDLALIEAAEAVLLDAAGKEQA